MTGFTSSDDESWIAAKRSAQSFLTQRRFLIHQSDRALGLASARLSQEEETNLWTLKLSFFPVGRLPEDLKPTHIRLLDEQGKTVSGMEIRALSTKALVKGRQDHGGEEIVFILEVEDVELARRLRIAPSSYFVELLSVENLDPFFSRSSINFSTRPVESTATSDRPLRELPQPPEDVDYLAKDYESFRTLMLEHMARVIPDWKERNPSDLGVTIIETLAYAGDYLSYFQDAVGTEAYLQTARRRVSVRRHGVLLDYRLSEGCTPRAWIQVELLAATDGPEDEPIWLPQGAQFLAGTGGGAVIAYPSFDYDKAIREGTDAFETLYGTILRPSMNKLEIYPWRVADFVLAAGSTEATLCGDHTRCLEKGDVLLFEQMGKASGGDEVDLARRQVVRLKSKPWTVQDPLEPDVKLTQIEWYDEDALAFPLPVRQYQQGRDGDSKEIRSLALVRGNLVLADLGRTTFEELPEVPWVRPYRPRLDAVDGRYRLIHHEPFILEEAVHQPAVEATKQDLARVVPALALAQLQESSWAQQGTVLDPVSGRRWLPKLDLIRSGRYERGFVVETENDGSVHLRFGNGRFGQRPEPSSRFWAFYRVFDSSQSMVGAGTTAHLVLAGTTSSEDAHGGEVAPAMPPDLQDRVGTASFPLGAMGGAPQETDERARLFAPAVVNKQERVVTAEDFALRAQEHEEVLDAYACLKWGGSWTLAELRVQRRGGRAVDEAFLAAIEGEFEGRLVMGYQVKAMPPLRVPLDIALRVRLKAHVEKRVVERRLKEALGNGDDRGEPAFFNPDSFGFGQDVELDDLVHAALAVPGILDVEVTRFRPMAAATGNELQQGRIPIAADEIAELTREFGRLTIDWVPI